MTEWPDRSPVRAAYLNPAFIAALLAATCQGYDRGRSRPMPWPLAHITAPLVLHRPTRERLPRTTATHLSAWIARNPILWAGFPARAKAVVPAVREGLRFGFRYRVLTLNVDNLEAAVPVSLIGDAGALIRRADFVGRWLGQSGDVATIFGLLGVEP